MTEIEDLEFALSEILPNFKIEKAEDGELIIRTGLIEMEDGCLNDLDEDDEDLDDVEGFDLDEWDGED